MPRSTPSSTDRVVLLERDEAVLHSLVLHPLMSFEQIRRLHFPGLTSSTPAKRCMARLHEQGLACWLAGPPVHRRVWYASAAGHAALGQRAARNHASVRGTSKVRHALAVNEFCVSLAQQARERGDVFTHTHWRNEVAHKLPGGLLVPDAVLTYELAGGGQAFRFLEMDLGTMPIARVQAKFLRYSTYWRSEHWRREYPVFPKVALVLAGPAQRERLRGLLGLAALVRESVPALEILVGTADDVPTGDPLANVWHWAGEEDIRGFLR
jgi:Replication-relaxation